MRCFRCPGDILGNRLGRAVGRVWIRIWTSPATAAEQTKDSLSTVQKKIADKKAAEQQELFG